MKLRPIALTGGPGGGKTTFLQSLRNEDPKAERFLLVPESATLLIQAGLKPGSEAFQEAVFRTQFALEQACISMQNEQQVILCDRGSLDTLAYWKLLGRPEMKFLDMTGMTLEEHMGRYHAAIHLQTTAIEAVSHYVQSEWYRSEPPEVAARIDRMCSEVWSRHPGYHLVPNGPGGWNEKRQSAYALLADLIRVPEMQNRGQGRNGMHPS